MLSDLAVEPMTATVLRRGRGLVIDEIIHFLRRWGRWVRALMVLLLLGPPAWIFQADVILVAVEMRG